MNVILIRAIALGEGYLPGLILRKIFSRRKKKKDKAKSKTVVKAEDDEDDFVKLTKNSYYIISDD